MAEEDGERRRKFEEAVRLMFQAALAARESCFSGEWWGAGKSLDEVERRAALARGVLREFGGRVP